MKRLVYAPLMFAGAHGEVVQDGDAPLGGGGRLQGAEDQQLPRNLPALQADHRRPAGKPDPHPDFLQPVLRSLEVQQETDKRSQSLWHVHAS